MNIGSVSHGTMLASDLIPCFIREIESRRPMKRSHRTRVCEIKRDIDKDGYYETDQADYDLESLFDILNEMSPPYFYFGANPGDGSNYGWWLQEDWQQQAIDDGAIKPNEVKPGYIGLILDVNERGNSTLLFKGNRQKPKLIWEVV